VSVAAPITSAVAELTILLQVNASAIEVGSAPEGAVSEVAHRLLRRAVEAVTGEESSSTGATETLQHGPQHAVVAATGFFLVAKLLRSEFGSTSTRSARSPLPSQSSPTSAIRSSVRLAPFTFSFTS